jgi:hypothetical protein
MRKLARSLRILLEASKGFFKLEEEKSEKLAKSLRILLEASIAFSKLEEEE